MRTSDFEYDLPSELIAQEPAAVRDGCRLLVMRRRSGALEDRIFRDIVDYVRPGDLFVANETRVLPARLVGHKRGTGGAAEVLLLREVPTPAGGAGGCAGGAGAGAGSMGAGAGGAGGELSPNQQAFWEALVKPGKRLKPGSRAVVDFADAKEQVVLSAEVVGWPTDCNERDTSQPDTTGAQPTLNASGANGAAGASPAPATLERAAAATAAATAPAATAASAAAASAAATPHAATAPAAAAASAAATPHAATAPAAAAPSTTAPTGLLTAAPPAAAATAPGAAANGAGRARGARIVRLTTGLPSLDEALHAVGRTPLPPYIKGYSGDEELYQTVYARRESSAAAPTAGLHFTPELIERVREAGASWETVELEVGLDTFRIVDEDDPAAHHMHTELYSVPERTAEAITRTKAAGGRVIAVGTTSVRSLESAWNAEEGRVMPCERAATQLYLLPGSPFHVVDALITNFHVPRSTLMMLVSAFSSRDHVMAAYEHAIAERYRFFSFGDAMFIC